MKKFFKSFVLALCSFSLFGCSGFHELGNGSTEEDIVESDVIENEITFEEFLAFSQEKLDYVNSLGTHLISVTMTLKNYEDGVKTKDITLHGTMVEGTLKVDNTEEQNKDALALVLCMALFSMPPFAQGLSEDRFDDFLASEIHYYTLSDGGYRAKCEEKEMNFTWNTHGLLSYGETTVEEDGKMVKEVFKFDYQLVD